MWNSIISKLNELGILALPSDKGTVIPEVVVDDNGESQPNWANLTHKKLCAQLKPLLPNGYRVEKLPDSDDYDTRAIFIGKARTLQDRNNRAFQSNF